MDPEQAHPTDSGRPTTSGGNARVSHEPCIDAWFAEGTELGRAAAVPGDETADYEGDPQIEDLYDELGRAVVRRPLGSLRTGAAAILAVCLGYFAWSAIFTAPHINRDDAMVGLDGPHAAPLPVSSRTTSPTTFVHRDRLISEEANFSGDAQLLDKPRPGEWLHEFPEQGQTYRQFLVQSTNRRTDQRFVIYLVRLGALDTRLSPIIALTEEFVEAYYGAPVRELKAIPLPIDAYDPATNQYDAKRVLARLKESLPHDALGLLAITEADLTIRGVEWVFGLGSARNRVAVFSVRRYGSDYRLSADGGTILRRSFITAAHELGHVLSMRHCTAFHCIMNGTNTLEEADEHPLHLCPVCARKVAYALRSDRDHRYRLLRDFYHEAGFVDEENFVRRRLDPPQVESEYAEFVGDLGPQLIEAGIPVPVDPPARGAPVRRCPQN